MEYLWMVYTRNSQKWKAFDVEARHVLNKARLKLQTYTEPIRLVALGICDCLWHLARRDPPGVALIFPPACAMMSVGVHT